MGDPTVPPNGKMFQLGALPPHIGLNLYALSLDAKTDAVTFTVRNPGQFLVALKYAYGGEVALKLGNRLESLTFSGDPSQGRPNFQTVYKGVDLTWTAKATPSSFGFSLGTGTPRLPMPWELQQTFQGAWAGAERTWPDIGSAPNDPKGFLRLHGKELHAIGEGVKAVQKLAPVDPNKDNFGAGVMFNYRAPNDPGPGPKGWNAMLYLQGTF